MRFFNYLFFFLKKKNGSLKKKLIPCPVLCSERQPWYVAKRMKSTPIYYSTKTDGLSECFIARLMFKSDKDLFWIIKAE